MELEGQADLMRELERMISEIGNGNVEIGFFGGNYEHEDGSEDDGESVVAVAFWNEFGIPSNNQPPRPYFRNMIAENQDSWLQLVATSLHMANNNGEAALGFVGNEIRGQLLDSIKEFTEPANAQSTIDKKGHSKPLEDSHTMINSVTYRVNS